MMRLNRVRELMYVANNPDRVCTRGCGEMWRWFLRADLVEPHSTYRYRITEKGRESLAKAIREHEAHGNFK